MDDAALEKNRRAGWARYFAVKTALSSEQLRRAELAVLAESLDPPPGHPIWTEIADALDDLDPFALDGIRRYVAWRLEQQSIVA